MPRVMAGAGVVAALIAVFLAAMYLGQRRLMYPAPPPVPPPLRHRAEIVRLDLAAGAVEALLLGATVGGTAPAPLSFPACSFGIRSTISRH